MYNRPTLWNWAYLVILQGSIICLLLLLCYLNNYNLYTPTSHNQDLIFRSFYHAAHVALVFFFIQHVSKQWSSWLYLNGLLANGSNWKMFFCCYLVRHGDLNGVHVFFPNVHHHLIFSGSACWFLNCDWDTSQVRLRLSLHSHPHPRANHREVELDSFGPEVNTGLCNH